MTIGGSICICVLLRFLHAEPEDIAAFLGKIQDKTLRETLSQGVAYMHEGLSPGDKRLVESLFDSGAIQVYITSKYRRSLTSTQIQPVRR